VFKFEMEAKCVNSMGKAGCWAGQKTPPPPSTVTTATVRVTFIPILYETTIGAYSSSAGHRVAALVRCRRRREVKDLLERDGKPAGIVKNT
jgi:hypothetical protein